MFYPQPPVKTPENEKQQISEWDKIIMNLIGNQQRFRENIVIPRILGQVHIKSVDEKRVEMVMESCAFKSFMSCVIGNLSAIFFKYNNLL